MEQPRQALKKLNVFAQMPPKPSGITMFSKARVDTQSDGIFGVAKTLSVLDVRLPEDFHPQDGAELARGLLDFWPKFLPCVLSFGVLGLVGWPISKTSAPAPSTSTANTSTGGCHFLITCVPFTTIVVGLFGHFAPTVWLYPATPCRPAAGRHHPASGAGDHLRYR
jgi:uncharacterized membrane protein